jgi:hypothetical protein
MVGKTLTQHATKIWLTEKGKCVLANNNSKIPTKDLKKIMKVVDVFKDDIVEQWEEHFGIKANFKYKSHQRGIGK